MKEDYDKIKSIRDAIQDYELVNSMLIKKRSSMRYYWSLWDIETLRAIKTKYWLKNKTSVIKLLYYLRQQCEDN